MSTETADVTPRWITMWKETPAPHGLLTSSQQPLFLSLTISMTSFSSFLWNPK